MDVAIRLFLVLGTLYVVGDIMYSQNGPRAHWRIFRVVMEFCLIMVVNALIMASLIGVLYVLGRMGSHLISGFDLYLTASGKINGSNIMVLIFVLVFLTAFIQLLLRKRMEGHWLWLSMNGEEYQIFEYFIQWTTIFCVVYQCFFDGFATLAQWSGATSAQEIFQIALSPDNLNLVLQPLLISSWILVVLERTSSERSDKC